ncbi:MAG: TetR family transcriptional regulator [Proteobacteria bacterium]|nr:TetR family transcriptional regulator [Pseudomonadota bacterium]MCP4916955.1 TetR family transcriptional regulator [Pseudomonadota bacterium]
MRGRLMVATIECLSELGYRGTTTTVVCRKAGVSRGAMLHHFPSRHELMVGAVERVMAQRRQDMELADPVEGMWSVVEGAATEAWLELVVAARTDPALRARVVEMTEGLREAARLEAERLGINHDDLLVASAAMDGLVLQRQAGLGGERTQRVLDRLKSLQEKTA